MVGKTAEEEENLDGTHGLVIEYKMWFPMTQTPLHAEGGSVK